MPMPSSLSRNATFGRHFLENLQVLREVHIREILQFLNCTNDSKWTSHGTVVYDNGPKCVSIA